VELPRRFLVGEVGLLGDHLAHELLLVGRDPRRVPAAVWARLDPAGLPLQAFPAVDRRLPDLEQLRGLLVRDATALQHGDHTLTQVDRVPLRHPPPSLERARAAADQNGGIPSSKRRCQYALLV
jgi:hypothetical protein